MDSQIFIKEHKTTLNYTSCWYHCLHKMIHMYHFLELTENSLLLHYGIITAYSGALLEGTMFATAQILLITTN